MADVKEYTYTEVAEHTDRSDLFMVIHDKVYQCAQFMDEHPGGEEVLMDVGGKDATEAFEDVGHSEEARELLEKMFVGNLKRGAGDAPAKSTAAQPSTKAQQAGGSNLAVIVALIAVLAFVAFKFTQ
ncbi:cytochrome b5 [Saitoella complicata NRRL Y-17804]|nr:cytochrome b5 [Saitoella complicata NRRL Y-17804]ODQ53825.1 cytochrome b5 [Saitoella complicata NRRL Y-17804]